MWSENRKTLIISTSILLAGLIIRSPVKADVVRLKNGGELHGILASEVRERWESSDLPGNNGELVIRTLSGAEVSVSRSHIESVQLRDLSIEQYERRARIVADDVASRWTLAEWCREKRLQSQREEQLRRIVELDPNHEKARYGLGYSRMDGRWIKREDLLRERGYVRYKGRYVSEGERELLEKADAVRAEEAKWFKKIRVWHLWLTGADAQRSRRALTELQSINDANAIRALSNYLRSDENENVRGLYVNILARISSSNSTSTLADVSLFDASPFIRTAALDTIKPGQYKVARPYYQRQLRNPLNEIVERSAAALARVGDEGAIKPLIDALVTTHQHKVKVLAPQYRFSTDGAFGPNAGGAVLPPEIEAGLLTGQYPNGVIIDRSNLPPPPTRYVTVQRQHENRAVLAALEKLTGESYGFDEGAWRLWWSAQKSGVSALPKSP